MRQLGQRARDQVGQLLLVPADGLDVDQAGGELGRAQGKIEFHSGQHNLARNRGRPMFHVDSEVGRLRQVVLHRPDLELKRLTPDNAADLLFDDVLWVSRAQAEHDAFAAALGSAASWSTTTATCWPGPWRSPRRASTSWTGYSTRAGTGRSPPAPCARRWPGSARASWRRSWPAGSPNVRSPNWGRSRRASPSIRLTPTVSCWPRCRTCCTSATPRAGSTAACPSTRYASRPGSARPSPARRSTAGTRCSPPRASRSGTTA